jgi:LCP family protein required for cell wall assembly
MLSIPRDKYVPIACFKNQRENKITHAAWYGDSCMIDTIENFTGINIDYYAKINFKGLVKLVDSLGGIYVDVPFSFCEQNSNREWEENTIYVEKGYQKLNGEQALALARNRHPNPQCSSEWTDYDSNDIQRGLHQQLVINGIMNEIKNINNLDQIYNILDIMSESIDTNMSTNTILNLYNVLKTTISGSNHSVISFDSLYLYGVDKMIWDTEMKLTLYNYYYYRQSLVDVVKAMNINLEKEEPLTIKTFSFSLKETYTKQIVGKGPYKYEVGLLTLPNFVKEKRTQSYLTSWCNTNSININATTEEVPDESKAGLVIKQSIPEGYILKDIGSKTLTITVGVYTEIDCTLEENISNEACLIE